MKYPRRAPGHNADLCNLLSKQSMPRRSAALSCAGENCNFPPPPLVPALASLSGRLCGSGDLWDAARHAPLPGAGGRPRRAQPPTGRTCRARTHRASPSCPSARGGAAPLLAHTKRTVTWDCSRCCRNTAGGRRARTPLHSFVMLTFAFSYVLLRLTQRHRQLSSAP